MHPLHVLGLGLALLGAPLWLVGVWPASLGAETQRSLLVVWALAAGAAAAAAAHELKLRLGVTREVQRLRSRK